MSAIATRITAEQYYDLTVVGDRKQLVDGEIVVNEPKLIHGRLQRRVLLALQTWAEARPNRGEAFPATDVRMDRHNVFAPDVLWFSTDHLPADVDSYPDRVPDLCVEIRSTSTWRYDIGAKKRVYESGGLPELWLVDDAAGTVLAYRRTTPEARTFDVALEFGSGELLSSPMLPGFSLAINELFRR